MTATGAIPIGEKASSDRTTPTAKIWHHHHWNEDVVIVPSRYTRETYRLLVHHQCAARPYQLNGRYGSRTHCVAEDDSVDNNRDPTPTDKRWQIRGGRMMGLPLVDREFWYYVITRRAPGPVQAWLAAILITNPMVTVECKKYHPPPAHRACDPPFIDARIHPERFEPPDTLTVVTTVGTELQGTTLEAGVVNTTTTTNNINTTDTTAFTYAELFAGIGGFGVALEALGGRCVFYSELVPEVREVYQCNFPSTAPTCIHGDIYQIPDEAFPPPGGCDVLVGGFPCQPFSALGTQAGLEDPRGVLFYQIVRFLRLSQPKAFLLENVPGLLQMTATYKTVVQALEEVGYHVTTEVCCARGLTAARRKRLYFVGLATRNRQLASSHPFVFPYIPDLGIRAVDVLDYDLHDQDPSLFHLLCLTDSTWRQLNRSGRFRPHHLAWPNVTCDTLISHYGTAVGRGQSQLVPCPFPHHPRRFSPRECARLLGFPNWYRIPFHTRRPGQGDMARCKEFYRMFGNAVCPPLIAALAGAVLDYCDIGSVWAGTTHPHEQVDFRTIGDSRSDPSGTRHKTHSNRPGMSWTNMGRQVAIRLAYQATLARPSHYLDISCIPVQFVLSLEQRFAERKKALERMMYREY